MNRHVLRLGLRIPEPFHQKLCSLYLVLGAKLDKNPTCSKVLSQTFTYCVLLCHKSVTSDWMFEGS